MRSANTREFAASPSRAPRRRGSLCSGRRAAAEGRGGAAATPTPVPALPDRPRGTDLILRELASGQELNVGNVADFTFSKDGSLLAWTIDAQDKVGNGLQLRDMGRGTVAVLDSGNASYERPAWTEKGDGLSVLKGSDDRALRDKRYVVLGFTGFGTGAPQKASYDPASDKAFPAGMTISPNRTPQWTEDLQALTFGIHVPRPRDTSTAGGGETDDNATPRDSDDAARPAAAPETQPRRKGRSRPVALARQAPAVAAGSAGGRRSLLQLPRRVPRAAEDVHPPRRRRSADGQYCAEAEVRDRPGRPRVPSCSATSTAAASRTST